MKQMKKLISILLVMAMALSMCVTAFAADTAKDETYTAYKIFDATISGSGDDQKVSYSIANGSAWLNDVQTYAGQTGKGLTLTANAAGTGYVVTYDTDNFKAADFAAYLAGKTNGKTADKTAKGTNGGVTLTGLNDGYYLVTSSLGSVCQLATGGEITIVEKNTVPSITKKVWEDSTNTYADSATIDVIDTVKYQLTVNTGTNDANLGTGVNGDYVITDVLPAGFAYSADTIAVKVGADTWTVGTDNDYTVEYTEATRSLKVTLKSAKVSTLAQNTDIVITYDAAVNAANATIGTTGNENTATLTYKQQSDSDTAKVYTYEIGGTGEGAPFTKVDGTTKEALEGVTFILSNSDGKYATVADGYLTGWVADKASATSLVTDKNGAIDVKGLDAGSYILTETATLAGYNLLTDTISVTIAEDGRVTYKLTSSNADAAETITVENNTGSVLPTTGGMGTTLLYTVGILLVLGAGVTLVVRRRMGASK